MVRLPALEENHVMQRLPDRGKTSTALVDRIFRRVPCWTCGEFVTYVVAVEYERGFRFIPCEWRRRECLDRLVAESCSRDLNAPRAIEIIDEWSALDLRAAA